MIHCRRDILYISILYIFIGISKQKEDDTDQIIGAYIYIYREREIDR